MRQPPGTWALTALSLLALAGCASGGATAGGGDGGGSAAVAFRGYPGFDTRDYPGDQAMTTWKQASPYQWVGYYLPAPCYTGTSWVGKRQTLETMGWGMTLIFVGEQDWAGTGTAAGATAPAGSMGAEPGRCTGTNLTTERAHADAQAAHEAGVAEGFAAGTVMFLDVERVETISNDLINYVHQWAQRLMELGHFTPGLYVHADNAIRIHTPVSEELARHGWFIRPKLWVADSTGFSIEKAANESPFGGASIWQGAYDKTETWGGVTLTIDVNVADSPNPSRGM